MKHRRGPPGTYMYDNRGNGMYARPLVGSRANPTKQRARSPDRTQAIARRKPGRFDPSPSGCRARLDEFARGERVPAWVAGLGARRLLCRPLVEDQNYFLCVNICVCTGPVSSGVEIKTLPVNRWKRTVTVPVLFLRGDTLSTDSTFASARAAARGARRV